jgi:hypothetical protein
VPDGNLDDFSHHAALPVQVGEKVSRDGDLSLSKSIHAKFGVTLTFSGS